MRWSLTSLLALASLASPQACKGGAQCLRHTDCTREEVCDLGTCVMKPTAGSGLGDAGSGAADDPPTTGGRLTASGGTSASGGKSASGGQATGGVDAANGGGVGGAGDAGAGG